VHHVLLMLDVVLLVGHVEENSRGRGCGWWWVSVCAKNVKRPYTLRGRHRERTSIGTGSEERVLKNFVGFRRVQAKASDGGCPEREREEEGQ
jgi:hypothetical protein